MLTIWDDVNCYKGILYGDNDDDNIFINKLWTDINFTPLGTRKRKLPQLDYWYDPMYVTDITFVFEQKIYTVSANIVCYPYINGKYDRGIEEFCPFIKQWGEFKSGGLESESSDPELESESSDSEIKSRQEQFVLLDSNVEFEKYVSPIYCDNEEHEYCDCDDGIVETDSGYFKNVETCYHEDGYEELRYYGDPLDFQGGSTLDYAKWKKAYDKLGELPQGLELICFLLILHEMDEIGSGK